MLIANDKCTNEWKTVKTKSKNNQFSVTKKSFASKFTKSIDNLIVNQITNTKPKLRVEKNNSHSICLSNAITENKNNTQSKNLIRTVPGNQSYTGTIKHCKKKHVSWVIVIYRMQICRIKKNLFNNSITEGRAHLNSFSGTTSLLQP